MRPEDFTRFNPMEDIVREHVRSIAYATDRQLLKAMSMYEVQEYKGLTGWVKKKIRGWLGITQLEGLVRANVTLRLEDLEKRLEIKDAKAN